MDMHTEVKPGLKICDWFSVHFGSLTDISDTAHLTIMERMLFSNFTVKEDLLKNISHKKDKQGVSMFIIHSEHTTSRYTRIYIFTNCLLLSTDGTPTTFGKKEIYGPLQEIFIIFKHCVLLLYYPS